MTESEARGFMLQRAEHFTTIAHLNGFGMSQQAIAMAVDLLTDMQMAAWHEGAIHALDQIDEKVKASR